MTDEKIALMEFKIEFDRGDTKEVTVQDNLDRNKYAIHAYTHGPVTGSALCPHSPTACISHGFY